MYLFNIYSQFTERISVLHNTKSCKQMCNQSEATVTLIFFEHVRIRFLKVLYFYN
jgi:hypothetical protein